jgi:hypothetical protein
MKIVVFASYKTPLKRYLLLFNMDKTTRDIQKKVIIREPDK